jgi:hypothetical protein
LHHLPFQLIASHLRVCAVCGVLCVLGYKLLGYKLTHTHRTVTLKEEHTSTKEKYKHRAHTQKDKTHKTYKTHTHTAQSTYSTHSIHKAHIHRGVHKHTEHTHTPLACTARDLFPEPPQIHPACVCEQKLCVHHTTHSIQSTPHTAHHSTKECNTTQCITTQ